MSVTTRVPSRPRWLVAALGIVLAMPLGLNMSASPAMAAPTGRVIAQPCLNLRTSPNSGAAVLGCIPYNTTITIACTENGSSMTGPYGTTTIWDKTTWSGKTGYVTDAYVYTGSNGAVAGKCSPPASTKAENALKWANARIGETGWNGWCEKFVENAYGTSGRYASAIAHYNAVRGQVKTTGTPPRGAIVFYAAAKVNNNWGHVMISRGDGSYVTTAAKVQVVNQSWPGAAYLGWYVPTAWPGR